MLIRFANFTPPIALENAAALIPVIREVFGTWDFQAIETSATAPEISVRHSAGRYAIDSPWLEETAQDTTEVGAACCLSIDLVRSFIEADLSLLCLHCAAIEVDGRLIVFPTTVRSGKSTLCVRLAAEGLRVFADDMLPIDAEGRGLALGIAPRLRIPLFDAVKPNMRAFIDAHAGPRDRRYLYLSLPATYLAAHGETAPIGAFVFLDRQSAGAAALTRIGRDEGLAGLLRQNIAETRSAVDNLDRLIALMQQIPVFTLRYADLDEAVHALLDGVSFDCLARSSMSPPERTTMGEGGSRALAEPLARRRRGKAYIQADGVTLRDLNGALFLVSDGDTATFHLNPVAAGLWRLLEEPVTVAEAAAVLRAAFPDADSDALGRDARRTFDALRRSALIRSVDNV